MWCSGSPTAADTGALDFFERRTLKRPFCEEYMYDNQQIDSMPANSISSFFSESALIEGRFRDFFARRLHNDHTRRAYLAAACSLSDWCQARGVRTASGVNRRLVREYLEESGNRLSAATVKIRLLALRKFFRWLYSLRVIDDNPFSGIREPVREHHVRKVRVEAISLSKIVNSIGSQSLINLRDRAIVSVLGAYFPPVRTLCKLRVGDFIRHAKGAQLRLGGAKYRIEVPCSTELAQAILLYVTAARIGRQSGSPLFRSIAGASGQVSERPLSQPDIYRIVRRRAKEAGLTGRVGPRELRF